MCVCICVSVCVCARRAEKMEKHTSHAQLKLQFKKIKDLRNLPEPARNPALAPRTSPEPAPQLLGIAQNETHLPEPPGTPATRTGTSRNQPGTRTRPSPNFLEPGKTHRNLQNQPEPAPEAAPNLIWAETPKLTLLEKNSMNTQAVGGVWVNVTTITTTICFLLGREAN